MELTRQVKQFAEKYKSQLQIFVCTFIAGYLIHFYMFTNKFLNYFEMNNILTGMSFLKSDTVAQGKWMIPVLSAVSSIYSMPAVNGVMGITFLSLLTVLVCRLLRIKNRFWGVMVGLVVMTYPSIASYFSYGVNTDVLTIAPCMAVLSVMILDRALSRETRTKKIAGILVGVLLTGLTVGAYQPFFAIIIAGIYGVLLFELLDKQTTTVQIVKKAAQYALILAAGFLVYYVGLKLTLFITGATLGDYHGVNEMTSFTLKGIAKGLVYTYVYYLRYFFTLEYANYPILIVANVFLTLLLIAMLFWEIFHCTEGGKDKGKKWIGTLMLCLFPLGTNATPFLMGDRVGNGVDRYMMISILFTYFILIRLLVEFPWQELKCKIKTSVAVQWCITLGLGIVVLSGVYMCNQAYYRMEVMTNQEDTFLNRVVGRIEETEGWSSDMPVYLANCTSIFNENYDVEIPPFEKLTRMDGTKLEPWYNRSAIAKYMRVYLHFPVNEATNEQIEQLEKTEEYQQMGIYPAADSIRIIDGVMVVKLNEESE